MSALQKNCEACGDIITVRLADHKRGWGRFCDKACAAAHKCGQRPRDVNAHHAKSSGWALDRFQIFSAKYPDAQPPKAPPIKSQIGKVKVTPVYHSPASCRRCGEVINGPGLCAKCDDHLEGMNAIESGWDGHKVWTS